MQQAHASMQRPATSRPITTPGKPAATVETDLANWLDRHAVAALAVAIGTGIALGWLVKRG